MRMLVVFKKDARLRHIGHLDLLRAMQRALRRSGLPIAYSQGFNPHILNAFASALSVGATGQREIMDVKLTENVDCETFKNKLNENLPPDIAILEAIVLEEGHPAPMSLLCAAAYDVVFQKDDYKLLIDAIAPLMSQTEIPSMRKTKKGMKPCDVKPLIFGISADENRLHMTLSHMEQDTCKPHMVLEALQKQAGLEALPKYDLIRLCLYGRDKDNNLAPLETL